MLSLVISNLRSARVASLVTRSKSIFTRNVSAVVRPTKTQSKTAGTSLAKDIIIYKNDNQGFMRLLSTFSLSQLAFWGFLSYSTMSLKDVPPPPDEDGDLPFYRKINLGDETHKRVLAGVYALIGYVILMGGWVYIVRSIRYVILRKDGATVSLVFYHPTGRNRIMEVPVNCVSAAGSRAAKKSYIPIRLKNKKLFYLLDTSGEFPRPELFDRTVGVHRKF